MRIIYLDAHLGVSHMELDGFDSSSTWYRFSKKCYDIYMVHMAKWAGEVRARSKGRGCPRGPKLLPLVNATPREGTPRGG